MLVTVLCIVNLTACGSSEESKPSVYSVGDVLNFSNSNGEEYSVCITDWGTSVDGSILDIFSLKTVTWFQYVIMNTGDEEVTVSDNIFNIYYNIGKRTPFLVKRCELGLARSSSEERRIDPNQDRTFLVETVKPRGKYGKAYGKCFVNGKPDDTYRQECYPNIKDEEIPCAGCGEWVLIDVPGVSLNEIFPIHKADEILMFGKYKGKTFGDIYKIDYQYLHWLEKTDRLFKVDFEELKQLYPDVEKQEDISIADQVIDFGKYKGQKFRDIKDDISYLEWLVSIDKISIEDFELLTTK